MIHFQKLVRPGRKFLLLFTALAAISCADLLGLERGQLKQDSGPSAGGSSSSGTAGASGATAGTRGDGAVDDASRGGGGGQDGAIDSSVDGSPDMGSSPDGPIVSMDANRIDSPVDASPGDAPPTSCNPTTCPTGCCDSNDHCVTTPSDGACGAGGARCVTCATGQTCGQGVCRCGPSCTTGCCTPAGECLAPSDQACGVPGGACTPCAKGQTCDATGKCVCNAGSCPNGCCDAAGACILYTSQNKDKCGTAGAMCGACGSGQACGAAGACECTPGSCPGGCCKGTTCTLIANQGSDACGSGGNACGTCAMGQTCTNGACSCGGVTCAGCCSGSQCAPSDHDHCGVGGGVCAGCGPKQECSAQGKCVCTAATCPNGCCDANEQCVETGTVSACGTGGAKCKACDTGLGCSGGQCVCGPSSCSGCCSGNVCVTTTGSNACGTGGQMCQPCEQGQHCNGTACVCDASSCSGCCNAADQKCNTSSKDTCGSNGAMCKTCAAGQDCNGTSCVCTTSSCTTGCCSGTTCVPFAQQNDTQCGAATTCMSCVASMRRCNTSNGQCFCNAASCPNGCCDGSSQCVPYAGQNDSVCGTGGLACSSCGSGKYCNGSGGCNVSTWCRMQTIPSGVDVADYQCADFDTGVLPSAWTLSQAAGGTGAISTAQASSTPNSFYSTSFADADTVGTLSWSHNGASPVTSVNVAVDVYRPKVSGDPGAWSGYVEEFCAAIGNARACFYYQGATGFGVAYWDGANRVSCGSVSDLQPNLWTRMELQIQSNGLIYMWVDGALRTDCNHSGINFPSSNAGSGTIGLARTGMALGLDMYFDNAVIAVHR